MTTPPDPPKATKIVLGQLLTNSGMGGAEIYVAHIANLRAKETGEAHVVVLGEPGAVSSRFSSEVTVHYLNYHRESIRNPLKFLVSLIVGYWRLVRVIHKNKIQLIQTHLPATNLWGLVLQLTGVCQVVATIHNNNFLRNSGGTRIGNFVKVKAYKSIIKNCPAVVAVSEEVKNALMQTLEVSQKGAARVFVVPNGVPIPPAASADQKKWIRTSHGIESDAVWIIAAGRLTEAKNFSCLVRAVQGLTGKDLKIRVTVAGEGELRGELERMVADLGLAGIVDFPGNVDDLTEMMQAADLLAMPSRWEGLPLVLLEAMAAGLPVVGSRINGLQDVIEEGVHGFLCEVDDSSCLAESMVKILGDDRLQLEMGTAAKNLVERKYAFKRVYAELDEIYLKSCS